MRSVDVSYDAWNQWNNSLFHSTRARNKRLADTFQLVSAQFAVFTTTASLILLTGITSQFLVFVSFISSLALMAFVFANQKTNKEIMGINAGLFYLILFSASMGVMTGPALTIYAALPNGPLLIALAAAITAAETFVLTLYAKNTRRNFKVLEGFLSMTLMGLLVVGLANFFLGSLVIDFASACVGVCVFSLYILTDVQKIRDGDYASPYVAAINLFLDILNLFLDILKILAYASVAKENKLERFPELSTLPKLGLIFMVIVGFFGFGVYSTLEDDTSNQQETTPVSNGNNSFFGKQAEVEEPEVPSFGLEI